jgi:RNA recognition motif-containing protein
MHILVVNIPSEYTEAQLKSLFEEFGTVVSAKIGKDKKTGASEGYGILEMPVKHEARAAVDALKGKEMNGKALRVRILKPDDPFHTGGQQSGRAFTGGSGQFPRGGMSRSAPRRGGQRGS